MDQEWEIQLNVDDHMDDSCDDIDGLLNDQFRDVAQAEGVYEGPNEDAKKFYNLIEENHQNAGKTLDDAFMAVFGKEKLGQFRGYDRLVIATSLKKRSRSGNEQTYSGNEQT